MKLFLTFVALFAGVVRHPPIFVVRIAQGSPRCGTGRRSVCYGIVGAGRRVVGRRQLGREVAAVTDGGAVGVAAVTDGGHG